MNAYEILRYPLLTEKSTVLREKDGSLCFRVDIRANKIEIARAIEELFEKEKVKVLRPHDAGSRQGETPGSRPRQTS